MMPERASIGSVHVDRAAVMRSKKRTYRNGYRRCKEHGWQLTEETRCTVRGCNRRLKIKSQSSTSRAARRGEEARY